MRLFLISVFAGTFMVLAAWPGTAPAQDKTAASIAVVDVDLLLVESSAGKSIQEQLKKKREAFQKEFNEKEKTLNDAQRALIEKKNELSAEDFMRERQEFESRLLDTKKLFQERRNSLDRGLGKAMAELRKKIIEVSADLAEEKGYDVLLTRDSVVIVEKNLNITDAVMSNLNKTVKEIKLETK